MHEEPRSRKAFESTTVAIEKIDQYRRSTSKELGMLQTAESELEKACTEEPGYLTAVFHSGVVKDLIGKPKDAVPFFEKILAEVPEAKRKSYLRLETRYNLAVAYYHQYSHSKLDKAEGHFKKVIEGTPDGGLEPDTLKNLARAGLAQAYAMWMIPGPEQKKALRERTSQGERTAAAAEVEAEIQKKFKLFERCEGEVRGDLEMRRGARRRNVRRWLGRGRTTTDEEQETWTKIEGTIDNARGMALMYSTDWLMVDDSPRKRIALLEESRSSLEEADRKIENDWANTCDLASVHMRLGIARSEDRVGRRKYGQALEVLEENLKKALGLLERVVNTMRPEYGFALYEIGRVYRVWGRFGDAIRSFDRALKVPVGYRDVSDKTVKSELRRAAQRDAGFP